jgi:hypothetical protein
MYLTHPPLVLTPLASAAFKSCCCQSHRNMSDTAFANNTNNQITWQAFFTPLHFTAAAEQLGTKLSTTPPLRFQLRPAQSQPRRCSVSSPSGLCRTFGSRQQLSKVVWKRVSVPGLPEQLRLGSVWCTAATTVTSAVKEVGD